MKHAAWPGTARFQLAEITICTSYRYGTTVVMITVFFHCCLFTAVLPTRAEDVPVQVKFRQFLSRLGFLYCHFGITISGALITLKLHVSSISI